MNIDIFGRYPIRVNYVQAKRILSLINEYTDWQKLNVGDVLDLNLVAAQLEEIIEKEEANNERV